MITPDRQSTHAPTNSPRLTWLPFLVISFVGGLLSYTIWGKTGEILTDFGDELYVAWQLSQGKVLFRDVASIFGPLSPTFNALAMRLFGPSLSTILAANLIILILTTTLLYRLIRAISTASTALIATIFFLCVFALAVPTRITNYNFLTPYRHQVTHGFLLTLAAITCLLRFYRSRSMLTAAMGGLLTGASFLTKPEIFLACGPTFILGLAAVFWLNPSKNRIARVSLIAFLAALALPLCFLIFYAFKMPFRAALDGVLSGWQFAGQPYVVSTPFYKGALGTDQPIHNLALMFQYGACYLATAIILASFALLGKKLVKQNRSAEIALGIIGALATFTLITEFGNHFDSFWPDAARGFPLFAAFTIAAAAFHLHKSRRHDHAKLPALALWCFSILSFLLQAKIILNARMYHYGFVLGAPCAMLLIIAFTHWVPIRVRQIGGSATIVRLAAIGILAAFVLENFTLTRQTFRERTLPIPLALGGTAWTRPIDFASVDAIKWLSATSATAAVIPDEAGINFASARSSSIPFTEMNPMTLAMFGQQNVLAAFARRPPDYILIVEISQEAFGARTFGQDYGVQLSLWISAHYRYTGKFSGGTHPVELWKFNQ